jgi:hypothetical protein
MKELKQERNRLMKECQGYKVKVDRSNLTVKQQVSVMNEALAPIKTAIEAEKIAEAKEAEITEVK